MRTVFLKGACALLSLLAPTISAAASDAGAFTVEKYGDKGKPIVFIPGLASGTWTWKADAQRLAKSHVVYLLALPGFDGRPARPGTTLASLQSDLESFIEHEHLKRPVLVGHSLGGTLSLAFAAEHSDLIAGVIAVDGLPVLPGTAPANAPGRTRIRRGAPGPGRARGPSRPRRWRSGRSGPSAPPRRAPPRPR